jgi:hypothetical protein
MSYSRWLTSTWYTFWETPANEADENRDTASFCICTLMDDTLHFSAKALRENRAECLALVREYCPLNTEEEIIELNTYMDHFIKDVDVEYPKT